MALWPIVGTHLSLSVCLLSAFLSEPYCRDNKCGEFTAALNILGGEKFIIADQSVFISLWHEKTLE